MQGAEAMLNLRWDFFSSHLASTLDTCYEKQYFVDTSLVCKDGTVLKCHKMILASASAFFRRLLVTNDHPHPMIILYDIEADDLKTMINFMYCGEIEVAKSEVRRLLQIAEKLEISGLKDIRASSQFSKSYGASPDASPSPGPTETPIEAKTQEESSTDQPKAPQQSLKSKYNLRQRSGPNRVNNSTDKSNLNKKIDVPNPVKAVIRNHERPSANKCQKNAEKRPLEQCQYLKKLRLLNEVEIIKKVYREDEDSRTNRNSSMNCGIFIKDEIDISSDEEIVALPIKKKMLLSSGVEIFRTYSKKMRESMASTSRIESSST